MGTSIEDYIDGCHLGVAKTPHSLFAGRFEG